MTMVAVMLYVDRFCLGYVAPYIRENLGLSAQQMGFVLDAFFYTGHSVCLRCPPRRCALILCLALERPPILCGAPNQVNRARHLAVGQLEF